MKNVVFFAAAATALASAPAAAYESNKYLHSNSPNEHRMQIGLCGDAPWFRFRWQPCWWV